MWIIYDILQSSLIVILLYNKCFFLQKHLEMEESSN